MLMSAPLGQLPRIRIGLWAGFAAVAALSFVAGWLASARVAALRAGSEAEARTTIELSPTPRYEHRGKEWRDGLDPGHLPPEPAPLATGVEVGGPGSAGPPRGRVALVIDDLGRSLSDIDALESLGIPISYSVLPFESRTGEVVERLAAEGHEVLCHLPMEPTTGANPGPGALRLGMSGEELIDATRRALGQVPIAVGVNNHMGSSLSADAESMRAILGVLGERGLFFLDSRTSPDSVGYSEAVALGLPAVERQVFLDPDPDPAAIREQFDRLLQLADRQGFAVAIGHPHRSTLDVLSTEVGRAQAQGFQFVPVSYLLDRAPTP